VALDEVAAQETSIPCGEPKVPLTRLNIAAVTWHA